jgi:GrpB-like predicted nucleotidyltransferase (UPF0157 family)
VRAVVDYDPTWPQLFAALGRDLRAALGGVALRIDHIGATAVPGLAAKPIVDVQISVASFEPLRALAGSQDPPMADSAQMSFKLNSTRRHPTPTGGPDVR